MPRTLGSLSLASSAADKAAFVFGRVSVMKVGRIAVVPKLR
jgi:hypothetical protein